MDMDKIISDLLEKRLDDFLHEAVGVQFDRRGHDDLNFVINEKLKECLKEREGEIKEMLRKAIDNTILNGDAVAKFSCNIDFNLSTYDLKRLLKEKE